MGRIEESTAGEAAVGGVEVRMGAVRRLMRVAEDNLRKTDAQ